MYLEFCFRFERKLILNQVLSTVSHFLEYGRRISNLLKIDHTLVTRLQLSDPALDFKQNDFSTVFRNWLGPFGLPFSTCHGRPYDALKQDPSLLEGKTKEYINRIKQTADGSEGWPVMFTNTPLKIYIQVANQARHVGKKAGGAYCPNLSAGLNLLDSFFLDLNARGWEIHLVIGCLVSERQQHFMTKAAVRDAEENLRIRYRGIVNTHFIPQHKALPRTRGV